MSAAAGQVLCVCVRGCVRERVFLILWIFLFQLRTWCIHLHLLRSLLFIISWPISIKTKMACKHFGYFVWSHASLPLRICWLIENQLMWPHIAAISHNVSRCRCRCWCPKWATKKKRQQQESKWILLFFSPSPPLAARPPPQASHERSSMSRQVCLERRAQALHAEVAAAGAGNRVNFWGIIMRIWCVTNILISLSFSICLSCTGEQTVHGQRSGGFYENRRQLAEHKSQFAGRRRFEDR